ncbi:hypothetical protein FMN52_08980 [Marinobacter sp. BW6]|nr:hypothetical protein FMN52_08980 [Marinobacter sp. BW6]
MGIVDCRTDSWELAAWEVRIISPWKNNSLRSDIFFRRINYPHHPDRGYGSAIRLPSGKEIQNQKSDHAS